MAKPKKESVSASFHYLLRENPDGDDKPGVPFSQEEFDALLQKIQDQPDPDLGDALTFEKVRYGSVIPFLDFERKNIKCAFGKFKAPYSGHSFDNSEKGKIAAKSVNRRQFNYLLYYSDNGRIYVGAQYLGNYGGWLPLAGAIKKCWGRSAKLSRCHSAMICNIWKMLLQKSYK